MSSAIHRLSDTLLRKLSGSPTTKNAFFNDGGNLSVRHSTSGLLTWYFTYRAGNWQAGITGTPETGQLSRSEPESSQGKSGTVSRLAGGGEKSTP